jgi:hypothetical protein
MTVIIPFWVLVWSARINFINQISYVFSFYHILPVCTAASDESVTFATLEFSKIDYSMSSTFFKPKLTLLLLRTFTEHVLCIYRALHPE